MKGTRRLATQDARPARFGVYLDLSTRKALLKAAIDAGVPATKLVEGLIRDYLTKRLRQPGSRG